MDLILPFKIGDFAEARSFVAGYNGAWFRCKVNDMRVAESGHLEYYLEYIDYIEEAKEWIGVFQKNPRNPASRKKKSSASSQIMLRPPFPQWYRGDQAPEHFSKSNVIASVCDTWKVGDLIEWLCEDCYWTAKITRLLSEDEVEVGLLEPPFGEGGCHRAKCKDLRPALDWSMVKGWTVPLSKANAKCWHAARLIHPKSDIEESNTDEEMASDDNKEEVRKSLKRASNISEEALGSSNGTPSDTNSVSKPNNQRDTIVTSTKKLRPSSTYKSSDPSHGVQEAVVCDQRGTCSSSKRQTSPTELVQVQSPDTVRGAMAEQNGPSNGIGIRRYPRRSRKLVNYASGKEN